MQISEYLNLSDQNNLIQLNPKDLKLKKKKI